jgi:hypothetical protein
MSLWPATLPQCPILNGFSEQRQRNAVSFNPDVGPPKLRRRSSTSGVVASIVFHMTINELEIFRTFFVDTLEDGPISFQWQHPLDGLIYDWWFDAKESPRIERVTSDTAYVSFNLLRFDVGTPTVPPGAEELDAFQSDAFQSDAFQ